jgi:hypothetical protein
VQPPEVSAKAFTSLCLPWLIGGRFRRTEEDASLGGREEVSPLDSRSGLRAADPVLGARTARTGTEAERADADALRRPIMSWF